MGSLSRSATVELKSRFFSSASSVCCGSLVARSPASRALCSFSDSYAETITSRCHQESLRCHLIGEINCCLKKNSISADRFDALETRVEPVADRLLGHLLLDDVLELFARQQLLQLQRFADVHRPVGEHAVRKSNWSMAQLEYRFPLPRASRSVARMRDAVNSQRT